ncbi:MAG: WhiB family transcriptional regulator [Pseudonocardiaceae bacterium]
MTASTGFGRGRGPMRATVLARELGRLLRAEGPATWTAQAACRDRCDDLMYPDSDEDSVIYQRGVASARAVCAWCPVRLACLEHAVVAGEDHGVWGGTTPAERRAMSRRIRKAKGA